MPHPSLQNKKNILKKNIFLNWVTYLPPNFKNIFLKLGGLLHFLKIDKIKYIKIFFYVTVMVIVIIKNNKTEGN